MTISISNLRKAYGSHVAVADLTMHVAPGEILGFLIAVMEWLARRRINRRRVEDLYFD